MTTATATRKSRKAHATPAPAPAPAPEAPAKTKAQLADEEYKARQMVKVEAVKAFAQEHYTEDGWDIVVETMTDQDIEDLVFRTHSPEGAIRKVAEHVAPLAEVRKEIQSA